MSAFLLPPAEDSTWAVAETDPSLRQRFARGGSTLTIEPEEPFTRTGIGVRTYAPWLTARSGRHAVHGTLAPRAEATLSLPSDPTSDTLAILSPTWCPRDVPGMGSDPGILGVSIDTVRSS